MFKKAKSHVETTLEKLTEVNLIGWMDYLTRELTCSSNAGMKPGQEYKTKTKRF
jgi:hypothetical protein